MDFLLRKTRNDSFALILRGRVLLSFRASITCGEEALAIESLVVEERRATFSYEEGSSVLLSLSREGDLFTLVSQWSFNQSGRYRLHLSVRRENGRGENNVFIPAVWYEGNERGEGAFPSREKGNSWSFLETRMSLPCAIELYDEKYALSLATTSAEREEELCSVSWDRHSATFTIPGAEWPLSYRGKKTLKDTSGEEKPSLERRKGERYERAFFFSIRAKTDYLDTWEHFLRSLEPTFAGEEEGGTISWDDYAATKLTRLLALVKRDGNGGAYLAMGEGNGEEQSVYDFTSASFLVKGVEAAYAFSRTGKTGEGNPYLKRQRERVASLFSLEDDETLLLSLAEKMGDYYLSAERREGVFQDCHDLKSGVWGGYLGIGEHPEFAMMVNSRCNGEAMKSYLLLYRSLKRQGREKPAYLALARRVARFYLESQLSGGSFGRWWTLKGRPENTQGTNGAYIFSFFCTLLETLEKDDPLYQEVRASLYKASSHYESLIEEGQFYGDTLDADSADKEAGLILLSIALDSWDITRDARTLALARKAASFVLTWMWQSDAFIPPSSPMGSRRFHTRGMTAVSVAHHHLDFYGMAIAVDFLRLASATSDDYYARCAKTMMEACRQLIATEKDTLGRDPSFYGWQPEQMNHTDWDYFDREEMTRGHYDIDIAWVHVLGYDSYLTLKAMGAL